MARQREQIDRDAQRRWPRANGIAMSESWFRVQLDALEATRKALENTPIDQYALPLSRGTWNRVGPALRRNASDGIVAGACDACRRWEAGERRAGLLAAVESMIADLRARQIKVRASRPSRPALRALDELCVRADDHVIAEAVLRLAPVLDEARTRFPSSSAFKKALSTDPWLMGCAFRFCHGLEELFISTPKPERVLAATDLADQEQYMQALRAAYSKHAHTLLATLGREDVVDTLFMTTRMRELVAQSYGTGPVKAATLAVVRIGHISEGTVDGIRKQLGVNMNRPLRRRSAPGASQR